MGENLPAQHHQCSRQPYPGQFFHQPLGQGDHPPGRNHHAGAHGQVEIVGREPQQSAAPCPKVAAQEGLGQQQEHKIQADVEKHHDHAGGRPLRQFRPAGEKQDCHQHDCRIARQQPPLQVGPIPRSFSLRIFGLLRTEKGHPGKGPAQDERNHNAQHIHSAPFSKRYVRFITGLLQPLAIPPCYQLNSPSSFSQSSPPDT